MLARNSIVLAASLLVACGGGASSAAPPGADRRAEISGFDLAHGRIAAVGGDVYLENEDGVQIFSPSGAGLRSVFDASYRACPWTNVWKLGPHERDDVTITYGAESAYVFQKLCGLWSVSLRDPSKVTPLLRLEGSSDENAVWADGTRLSVNPSFDVAVAQDGDGLLVCLTRGTGGGVRLWSTSREGKPGALLGEVEGAGCTEILRDDAGAFLSLSVGGVQRWDRASRAVTRVVTASKATSLQQSATHLFFVDGGEIMRVRKDGDGLARIERDAASRDLLTRLIVGERDLYVATQSKIVRMAHDGGAAETLLAAAPGSLLATEHGFVSVGESLWFVSRETGGEKKRYLARLPN